MDNVLQAKYQFSRALAKAQMIAAMVNLNTRGFAEVRFSPEYMNVQMQFAPRKTCWDSRLETVTTEYLSHDVFINNVGGDWAKRREITEDNRGYKDLMKSIKLLTAYTELLEHFLLDQNFDMLDDPALYHYTETVKYQVFRLAVK